jgi:uncharacterized protein YjbJ (UPF0337 family)
MLNVDVLQQNWKRLRTKIRPRWMALTDQDVANIDGNRDTLKVLLIERYGYSEIQANQEVEHFLAENAAPEAAQQK